MNEWKIDYWLGNTTKNPIQDWLNNLSKAEFKSITKELELLKLFGNNLRMPHSKSLGKGLFELRERKSGFRLYYCFKKDQIIILLAAGDKASQEKDIATARKRILEL